MSGHCSFVIEEKFLQGKLRPLQALDKELNTFSVRFRKVVSVSPEKRAFYMDKDRLWQGVRSNARIFSIMGGICT
jgi:hypothetical protein